ncbi:hypothetical protein ABDD95_20660 [Mucilaginibacter sp. PAMB04274]|uniref:hypothetical protein n=1 Tax=Mucilaginibacter sp. PAMB04274 TaxID=3138568 RepID=UPI0031F71FA0
MIPETVEELLNWLSINCYAENYAIGKIRIFEGYGLDFDNDAYVGYYTERGQRQNFERFEKEEAAVAYAFGIIKADIYANRHMIGFVKTESELQSLMKELDNRGITYINDVLFYSNQPPRDRFRVFAFGCDVRKVKDLEKRYAYRGIEP